MNAVVFGAAGGIGRALVAAYVASGRFETVFAISRRGEPIEGAVAIAADAAEESDLTRATSQIAEAGPLTHCVVAIGLLSDGAGLQPEKSLKQQSADNFERIFRANTIAPALIAKHILPILASKQPVVFAALSARVGSITDNRLGGWHAYRASKAALNMLIKTYSIEMRLRNPDAVIISLHPGTVDTQLSAPFQSNTAPNALFTPQDAAAKLLTVIDGLTAEDSGGHFDWAGKPIAP